MAFPVLSSLWAGGKIKQVLRPAFKEKIRPAKNHIEISALFG